MGGHSWFAKLFGRPKAPEPRAAVVNDRPPLQAMADRVADILGGEYSRSEHAALAEQYKTLVKNAGPSRSLRDRELIAAFVVCARYALPYCPDEGSRKRLQDLLAVVERYVDGSDVERSDISGKGTEAVRLLREAEATGDVASAALRRAVESGGVTPELAVAFDNAGRHVRAAKAVAQSFAVLAYVHGVSERWATPNTEALDRLFRVAGENAAHQVLSVDKTLGVALLSDILAACHGPLPPRP